MILIIPYVLIAELLFTITLTPSAIVCVGYYLHLPPPIALRLLCNIAMLYSQKPDATLQSSLDHHLHLLQKLHTYRLGPHHNNRQWHFLFECPWAFSKKAFQFPTATHTIIKCYDLRWVVKATRMFLRLGKITFLKRVLGLMT